MNEFGPIDLGISAQRPLVEIARKIYLTYPTNAFVGNEEREFVIINKISEFFKIPIMNIQVTGSSKTGRSFHKKTTFNSTSSDLDVAIIDRDMFQKYSEWAFRITNGYMDLTKFTNGKQDNFRQFCSNIARGIFRPDLMPSGTERASWFKFFADLSRENLDLFKSINGCIYFSQTFFEFKQIYNINEYLQTKE